ncbi:MAG: FRG domain-containing protein [Clostridia bacterium]|nr:FRG domain-containing protein [Clostridia bacterium]MBR4050710.1 FRG domain-containing protein [Clostridia bacterium]
MSKINSLKAFVEYIMKLREESLSQGLSSHQWFFRGQENSEWSIYPNVFRNDGVAKENHIIQGALRQNPFEFQNKNDFEILTKLQHYGLGTRLLDVTLNPLVALYFATEPSVEYKENKNGQFSQEEKDGVVFFQFSPWHTTNELCIRIASTIPFLEINSSWTTDVLLNKLKTDHVITDDEESLLIQDNCKLLVEYLQDSFFVISSHSNERLIRQSGAFIIPTFINFENGHNVRQSQIAKSHKSLNEKFSADTIIIPAKSKQAIREELDFFNINEATLFPELEHQMTYIKQRSIPISGIVPSFIQFDSSGDLDTPMLDYNDKQPNARVIITKLANETSLATQESLIIAIEEMIQLIDWKQKQSIRSKIKRICKRILQEEMSVVDSTQLSESILNALLSPSVEMVIHD